MIKILHGKKNAQRKKENCMDGRMQRDNGLSKAALVIQGMQFQVASCN